MSGAPAGARGRGAATAGLNAHQLRYQQIMSVGNNFSEEELKLQFYLIPVELVSQNNSNSPIESHRGGRNVTGSGHGRIEQTSIKAYLDIAKKAISDDVSTDKTKTLREQVSACGPALRQAGFLNPCICLSGRRQVLRTGARPL